MKRPEKCFLSLEFNIISKIAATSFTFLLHMGHLNIFGGSEWGINDLGSTAVYIFMNIVRVKFENEVALY